MAQINTAEKVALSAVARDAAGHDVPATLTWSVDHPEIVTLSDNGDGTHEAVATAPGVAVVTVTDGTTGLAGSVTIEVLTAPVASVAVTEGAVAAQ